MLFQMCYRFRGYWDFLRVDTLIAVELNPSQPTVSGDILILLPDGLVQTFNLNLARLLREDFRVHFDPPIGVKGIEQSNG